MADFFDNDTQGEDTGKLPVDSVESDIIFITAEEDEAAPTTEQANGTEEKKKKNGIFGDVFDCFETFCYALVLMMILFVFVFRFVTVNGTSMLNTLQNQDKLIISDMLYTPDTGDIVVLDASDHFSDKYIIKRIIATGGQTVEINFDEWSVKVNGQKLDETYVDKTLTGPNEGMKTDNWINTDEAVQRTTKNGRIVIASFTVPEGMVFVMGDNRNGSSDGRYIGFLEEERILGRVLLRIGPIGSFGRVE